MGRSIAHRGRGTFVVDGGSFTVVVDPRAGRKRRFRVPERADYVVLTGAGADEVDGAADVLDQHGEALLIGPRSACRAVAHEVELSEESLLDLEPWERVRNDDLRVTALDAPGPVPMPRFGTDLPPLPFPQLRGGRDVLDPGRFLDTAGLMGGAPNPFLLVGRALRQVPMGGGMDLMDEVVGGATAQPVILELAGGPSVAFLGDSIGIRPDLGWLEDVAETGSIDVLVVAAGGARVHGVVWAVRKLQPKLVLLYRASDPYAVERPMPAVPMARFIEALEEDAPDVEVVALRDGDAYHFAGFDDTDERDTSVVAGQPTAQAK